jgi:hypothetical protein
MNKPYYSPEFLNDLDEIWEYIFESLQNPAALKIKTIGYHAVSR